MINGLFGVRFLFSGTKMERCSIDDYSSILQRPLLEVKSPWAYFGLEKLSK